MKSRYILRSILYVTYALLTAVAAVAQTPIYKLATTSLLEGKAAGSDSVTLAVYPNTNTWTAIAGATWLHLSPNFTNGIGGTNVIFSFDTNAGPTRTGTLTIQGTNVTVTQAGSNYVYANPTTELYPNSLAWAVTVDSSGNAFIANNDTGNYYNLIRWSRSTGATNVLLNNYYGIFALTMDNTQNPIFLQSSTLSSYSLYRYTITTGQVSNLLATTLSNPSSMFMDWSNIVYVADYAGGAVKEWNGSGGFFAAPTPTGYPTGVAVDILGNFYVSDAQVGLRTPAASYKWNPNPVYMPYETNMKTILATGSIPSAIAIDGSGNAYIGDRGLGVLLKWSAATGTTTNLAGQYVEPSSIALDSANNIYLVDYSTSRVYEIPNVYADPTPKFESATAGQDKLNPVIPSTFNLGSPFAPTSDSSWLKITSTAAGYVYFSFTANTNVARTAHISLLGQSIPITQQGVTPPILTGLKFKGNGVCQFSFTNVPGKTFRVVSSPDLSVPFTNWTVVGHATNTSGTTYQFTTKPDTSDPAIFYGIRWP